MVFNFIVKEDVLPDIMEIVDWYNHQQIGLGDRFYKTLLSEFEKIIKNPTSYSFYKKDFRRAVLKYFPYLILFKVYEQEIIVYSVIYGGRNPQLINRKIS
jgi:plasmid stabilization system protein ParE